jgi:hypothetical protein
MGFLKKTRVFSNPDLRSLGGRMGERELSSARGGGGGGRRPEDPLRLDKGGQAGPDTGQGNPRVNRVGLGCEQ